MSISVVAVLCSLVFIVPIQGTFTEERIYQGETCEGSPIEVKFYPASCIKGDTANYHKTTCTATEGIMTAYIDAGCSIATGSPQRVQLACSVKSSSGSKPATSAKFTCGVTPPVTYTSQTFTDEACTNLDQTSTMGSLVCIPKTRWVDDGWKMESEKLTVAGGSVTTTEYAGNQACSGTPKETQSQACDVCVPGRRRRGSSKYTGCGEAASAASILGPGILVTIAAFLMAAFSCKLF